MKTASRIAVSALLAMSLSGCVKKAKTAQPEAQAPALPLSKMVYIPKLPALPPPSLPDVAVATAPPEAPAPPPPRRVVRRKSSVARSDAPATEKPEPASQTQAGNTAAAGISPIGQLSSTEEATSSQGRQNIERLINETENGLNGIKRALSSDEQTTATQIRTFLAKAKQALADNDLDGAQTLADKAKVLLQELMKK